MALSVSVVVGPDADDAREQNASRPVHAKIDRVFHQIQPRRGVHGRHPNLWLPPEEGGGQGGQVLENCVGGGGGGLSDREGDGEGLPVTFKNILGLQE